MVKPELNELKKQFTPKNCSVSRICGCYVDGEKNIKTTFSESFLNLPELETFKYFEILRKSLSGTIGKNALNLEFPNEQEIDGGTQDFLFKLRNSKLKDEALLNQFYDMVINYYDYVGNYLILIITDTYDVPVKTTDGIINDESDSVYDYILCSICPVNLSKPGLSYDAIANEFHNRIQDWVVDLPDAAFLFPAFNDRASDIHSCMYYIKNSEEMHDDFVNGVLGCSLTLTAKTQKAAFQALIEETLGDDNNYEIVQNIHENLTEMETEHKNREIVEPLKVSKKEVKNIFEKSGVDDEKMKIFDKLYDAAAGEKTELFVSNLHNSRSYEVKTPDVVIKVNPERSDLVKTQVIDGIKYLMIEVTDQVEVNGVEVRV